MTSSSTPKVVECDAVYTKGGLLCVQQPSGLIVGYPLCNVFSVAWMHQPHKGTTRTESEGSDAP